MDREQALKDLVEALNSHEIDIEVIKGFKQFIIKAIADNLRCNGELRYAIADHSSDRNDYVHKSPNEKPKMDREQVLKDLLEVLKKYYNEEDSAVKLADLLETAAKIMLPNLHVRIELDSFNTLAR